MIVVIDLNVLLGELVVYCYIDMFMFMTIDCVCVEGCSLVYIESVCRVLNMVVHMMCIFCMVVSLYH